MNIEKIIQECLKEKSKAQYELYTYLYKSHISLCMRYRRDKDKADISFNNAFVKVLDHLVKLKDIKTFKGWVKRIIINQMLTEIRKEKIEQSRYIDINSTSNIHFASVSNLGSEKLNAEYLMELLAELPPMTGIVFNLFAIDGYSHKEIGQNLSISEGTSKWHVADARKKLRTKIMGLPKETVKQAQG